MYAMLRRPLTRLRRLHADEAGTISIATVIALLLFTMLLGMLINVGQQIDDKMKLQNAADSATYSGGVVLARGMNAVAFTNHLLSEVFALTAYMREGRDRSSERIVPDILAAWERVGPQFAGATGFPKFLALGPAISAKVPLERELVAAFGEMTARKSEVTLPVFEYILGVAENQGGGPTTHLIPQFQRAVVQTTPVVAQLTMAEIAGRFGPAASNGARSQPLSAVLWRTRVQPAGTPDQSDAQTRTLPAIDPSPEGSDMAAVTPQIFADAVNSREQLARRYLSDWINDGNFDLGPFEREQMSEGGRVSGKMSQFINLWRNFTCAQLMNLLNTEFPNTNLPHMIRPSLVGPNPNLGLDYIYIGVVYWPQRPQFFPGMYKSPIRGDAQAFAQVFLFLPRARYRCCPWATPNYDNQGNIVSWNNYMDNWSGRWDLFNQNWTSKLVPADNISLPLVLRGRPGSVAPQVNPPSIGASAVELNTINTH